MTTTTDHTEVANKLRRLIKRYTTTENLRYIALQNGDEELADRRGLQMRAIHKSVINLVDKHGVDVDPSVIYTVLSPVGHIPFTDGYVA